ncbi:MAG: fibronectin type III domain-containing protein [Ruminococcaceae bacterium]|nr:fibronectin type III domain-containing protein [Oscillospiraceae bacterium]
MLKRFAEFWALLVFIGVFSVFYAGAQCEHNFSPDTAIPFYGIEGCHAFYCLNGCGSYGTEHGGADSFEKCSFTLVSEVKATCRKSGSRVYLCTVCKMFKDETVPVQRHSYKKSVRLPTCTEKGYDMYVCSGCGDTYKDNYVSTVKHISDGGKVELLPDYDKNGTLRVSCRVCGCIIERKTLPKLVRTVKTVGKVKSFKVKAYGTDYVKLSWKKSEGAASYEILYSTDKKKWKTVSSEKNTYTVKKLKSAQRYYFKISAIGKDSRSAFSDVISVCTEPKSTSLTKVKSVKKASVNLEWKKLSNVSGYVIEYVSGGFDKKKKIKTVTVTKNTGKKTVKKLKSGKKYSFRIKAYKKYGSSKIYGAYSKTKTVKIR